jgi:hypothetical protein
MLEEWKSKKEKSEEHSLPQTRQVKAQSKEQEPKG